MSDAAADGDGARLDAVAVERLWLDRLYDLGKPVAHEVRNALNGVAVNLEVVRSRAAKADAPASSVVRFADSAADQLEALAELTDALLALVRPVPEPADVGALATRIGAILGAVARADGGQVTVRVTPDGTAVRTGLAGEPLRLLLAGLLLDAFDRRSALTCDVDGTTSPTLRFRRDDGQPLPEMPADLRALATRLDVRLMGDVAEWTMVLPAATT